jgi:hypothetical protein
VLPPPADRTPLVDDEPGPGSSPDEGDDGDDWWQAVLGGLEVAGIALVGIVAVCSPFVAIVVAKQRRRRVRRRAATAVERIEGGWLEFDRVLTTPEVLKDLTKVAKVLGPKGLMPNKKTGTVTSEIGKAVKEQKLGKVEFKVEKAGILHSLIGKKSFGAVKLKENFLTLFDTVLKAKPTTSKGVYIRKVAIAPAMGPSLILDHAPLVNASAAV